MNSKILEKDGTTECNSSPQRVCLPAWNFQPFIRLAGVLKKEDGPLGKRLQVTVAEHLHKPE